MRCPQCDGADNRVVDTRTSRGGRAVRRRRECLECGERFTTYEAVETQPVLVVKRSGERMAYHRDKVILGVTKACEKRPVSLEQIEITVDRVEQKLATAGRRLGLRGAVEGWLAGTRAMLIALVILLVFFLL